MTHRVMIIVDNGKNSAECNNCGDEFESITKDETEIPTLVRAKRSHEARANRWLDRAIAEYPFNG